MIPTPPSFSSLTDISQPSKRRAADDRDNYRSKPNIEEGCPMATMIIEGERTRAASGKTYEVRNPATGEVVDEVPQGGPADVDKAAQAAAKAFGTWSKLPAHACCQQGRAGDRGRQHRGPEAGEHYAACDARVHRSPHGGRAARGRGQRCHRPGNWGSDRRAPAHPQDRPHRLNAHRQEGH